MKKKLNLRFQHMLKTRRFLAELRGKVKFHVTVHPFFVELSIPDTPRNRSAISVTAYKYGIVPSSPLIKFDEYMELFYQGKVGEMRDKICQDVFNYVKKHFGLKDNEIIIQLFCTEKMWKAIGEKWGRKFFLDTTSATVAYNYTFNPTSGVIHPRKGCHLILLNSQVFDKLNPPDQVFNYALTLFHEAVHISGVKDDVKVHMLEFMFSKEFLGIYHSKEYISKKRREIKEFLSN